ncbi:hypothetical protein O9993_18055 [Vibrio lentus]|nr:hypothetical protein [Vibrio lentus]
MRAASTYTVKNNGGGEWSVQLPQASGLSFDLSELSILPRKTSVVRPSLVWKSSLKNLCWVCLLRRQTCQASNCMVPVGDDVDTLTRPTL